MKFVFLSTHGDPHYIGLNGIEVYDWTGQLLPITAKSIQHSFPPSIYPLIKIDALAIPSSVAILPDMHNDVRTIANLFDSANDTFDDRYAMRMTGLF